MKQTIAKDTTFLFDELVGDVKTYIIIIISNILSVIEAEAKHLPNGIPTPEEMLALGADKHPILRNSNVARTGYNLAVDKFQELLKSAKESIKL